MTTAQHILVPTDFSQNSKSAARYAIELAAKLGARITLLHVWDVPPNLGADSAIELEPNGPQPLKDYAERAVAGDWQDFTAWLEPYILRQSDQGATVMLHERIEVGNPQTTIVDIAEEGRFDLIVMGTHGRRGLRRILMGSVAEHVLRFANCPVLTVSPQAADLTLPGQVVAQPTDIAQPTL